MSQLPVWLVVVVAVKLYTTLCAPIPWYVFSVGHPIFWWRHNIVLPRQELLKWLYCIKIYFVVIITTVNYLYPPGSPCPIYWTYILYSLLQFEQKWTINLLVIIYINTSTIDFYKFGIKSAVCFFLRHPANPRWQPLCRSDSTRSERVSVTRTNCRWKWSIPANLSVCVL